MDPQIAAQIYLFFTFLVVLFQMAMAAGAPLGHLAMGGKYPGQFPPKLRVAAIVQMLLLIGLGGIIAVRAGIWADPWFELSQNLIWVVVAVNGLSLIGNLATPSKFERILWAPVTAIMLFCASFVALS